jgi:site-specific recombinase XerD
MTETRGFQTLLERFFINWLGERMVSPCTISSYRDAFILLLRWMGESRDVAPSEIVFADLDVNTIERFLNHLSQTRNNTAKTVNCRLAAIKSFFLFVSYQKPEHLAQIRSVLEIRQRVERKREVDYLTPEEIGFLLDACVIATKVGRQTHLMIRLLYNSGARISELLALKVKDFTFSDSRRCSIHILGKGRKERTLPLWEETGLEVLSHMDACGLAPKDFLFAGRNVERLTRSGARSRLDSVVKVAAKIHPELDSKLVTPHVFRHSTAVSMLAAGIDLSTIAIWLGHESIETTHKYMVANMDLKERAIEKVHQDWGVPPTGRYRPDPDILEFLASL